MLFVQKATLHTNYTNYKSLIIPKGEEALLRWWWRWSRVEYRLKSIADQESNKESNHS